jgi:hypothetical protein
MSRLRIVLASFAVGLFIASAIAADKQSGSDSDHAVKPTAPALTPTEQKIKSKLDQKVSINLADQPLGRFMGQRQSWSVGSENEQQSHDCRG